MRHIQDSSGRLAQVQHFRGCEMAEWPVCVNAASSWWNCTSEVACPWTPVGRGRPVPPITSSAEFKFSSLGFLVTVGHCPRSEQTFGTGLQMTESSPGKVKVGQCGC